MGGVGKRREDGDTFVPMAELIRVVAAAELAALASGDQHEGIVPVAGVGDEAHGGAVMAGGCARTECGAPLRLAGDAEKLFEPAFAAEWVEHFERIEALPGPVFDFWRARVFFELLDGFVGGGNKEFVIILVARREPGGRAFSENALEESSAAPLVEIGVSAESGLQDEFEGCPASGFKKRDGDGIRVGDSVPIFGKGDEFLGAGIFGCGKFCSRRQLFGEENVGVAVSIGLDFHHVGGAEIVSVVE